METKKLKKLSLKKETIANLSNVEQTRIIGGETMDCTDGGFGCPFETEFKCPSDSCACPTLICSGRTCNGCETGPCTTDPCGGGGYSGAWTCGNTSLMVC